jgi:hypothetical protein
MQVEFAYRVAILGNLNLCIVRRRRRQHAQAILARPIDFESELDEAAIL